MTRGTALHKLIQRIDAIRERVVQSSGGSWIIHDEKEVIRKASSLFEGFLTFFLPMQLIGWTVVA
jgi:hypothetical protein